MTTAPLATPVTRPVLLFTEAILVLLLDHVPPVVALSNCIVLPVHTLLGPVIAATVGGGLTMTETENGVIGQPLAEPVMVKLDVCGEVVVLVRFPAMDDKNPPAFGSIPIKLLVLFLVHVDEVRAGVLFQEIVKFSPEQTVIGLGDVNVITGVALTVIRPVAETFVQGPVVVTV